ncbi:hypothetical protein RhiJN_25613 [Ceratobasidium sp. AG-Ba]|nr:hypothetical protein RhiJN_25613 [Ceratobasidium sp. AG-Ba]
MSSTPPRPATTAFYCRLWRPRPLEPVNRGNHVEYYSAVGQFCRKDGIPLDYKCIKLGPDHKPTWVVTPIIIGEEHADLTHTGASKQSAKEFCATAIAMSGYCCPQNHP